MIGPGGGGAMFHPTISPHDPNVVLVGCDMTGAYLTKDGGKSWRMINLRGVTQFFVFDPSNANTIYIYSMGLWRSTDAGATWALVHPNPKSVTGIAMLDDHAEAEFRDHGRGRGDHRPGRRSEELAGAVRRFHCQGRAVAAAFRRWRAHMDAPGRRAAGGLEAQSSSTTWPAGCPRAPSTSTSIRIPRPPSARCTLWAATAWP